jgi:60 kDa SS-A/Ro ribonucleoprotein
MSTYLKNQMARVKNVPQSEPLNERQVPNSSGGYSFPVTDWVRLDRFLILGSEGGSYYATEQKLTKQNADGALRCIKEDGEKVVNRVVEISHSGRAPKNDPALFVLALCAAAENPQTRHAALAALPKVARIGTHLFHFAEYVNSARGWGRGLRKAIANWYLEKDLKELQNQLVKYQQRDGWSHGDLLRLAHPVSPVYAYNAAFRWALGEDPHEKRVVQKFEKGHRNDAQTFTYKGTVRSVSLSLIEAFEAAKTASTRELLAIIRENGLTREMVPTEALTKPEVWEALLEKMPMTAMIRNLANMTRCGLLKPLSETVHTIADRLHDGEALHKARVHPIQVLMALKTYEAGHGVRSRGEGWTPVQEVVDALDDAFYASFTNVEPTGKRWFIGLDVSGSMSGGEVAGCPGLTPNIASAALCMVTARTEKQHVVMMFDDGVKPVSVSPRERLDAVAKKIRDINGGGTDCALPMLHAAKQKMKIDTFAVYTDSETWAGRIHPTKALQNYRNDFGIPAKLIVVGMVSNGFTIADPNDAGMMDVVGFDASAPALMADFSR